jgi:type VI secretion system secreted protein Hcp
MIVINFEAGPLKDQGKVTATGYAKYMEVDSFQWGVGRGISMTVGGGKERKASVPSFSEVSFSRQADDASPVIFQESVRGKGNNLKICIIQLDAAGAAEEHCVVELDDCLISSYSASAGGDGTIQESFSISFTKIDYGFTERDETGAADGALVNSVYDLTTAASE